MDEIIKFLKNFNELFGVIGVVGSIINFWAKLHPKYAIPIGFVCALFILIWGSFERSNSRPLIRTLAWVGIILSIVANIFFITIGAVLLLRSASDPGKLVQKSLEECLMGNDRNTAEVLGKCPIRLLQHTSLVEIGLAPAPEDLERIKDLEVIPRGNLDQLDKITFLANKTSASQSYFRVENPRTDFQVILDTVITLKEPGPTPVRLYVTYYYIDHDFLWEARQWIFRNLDW